MYIRIRVTSPVPLQLNQFESNKSLYLKKIQIQSHLWSIKRVFLNIVDLNLHCTV